MIDLVPYLPAKHKLAPSGWYSFNSVCCIHRGERADRRGRGGLLPQANGGWRYHCFNCSFSASYVPGQSLSQNARKFLTWLGVNSAIISRFSFESIQHRNLFGRDELEPLVTPVSFEDKLLPLEFEDLQSNNASHAKYISYLRSRAVDPASYSFKVTPTAFGRDKNKIIIPFTYKNKLVGWTARFIDNSTPKYYTNSQPGYVFGIDLQKPNWQRVIVCEGIFDALQLNGLALMHNDISDQQAFLIRKLGRTVIVLPDRDQAGLKLVSRAIELGWAVSFPDWPNDIKDAADAVARYGKLATLVSIVESCETSRLKIELKLKSYAKRI